MKRWPDSRDSLEQTVPMTPGIVYRRMEGSEIKEGNKCRNNPRRSLSPEFCQRSPNEILMESVAVAVSELRFSLFTASPGMRNAGKALAPTGSFGSGEGIWSKQSCPAQDKDHPQPPPGPVWECSMDVSN